MENVTEIVLFLGGIQGVLLSVFLFTLKANRISNRLLGMLTFLWGVFLFAYGLQFEGLYKNYPHFLKVFYQFLFVFFPLLYLHAKYLMADYNKFQKKDFLHFIPFLISIILYSDFFIQPADVKLMIIKNKSEYYRVLQIVGDEFVAVQGIVYSIVILTMVGKYKKRIKDYESTVGKTLIHALYIGTSLNLLAWTIGFIGIQIKYLHYDINVDFFTMTYLVMVIVIYVVSFFAIKSPEIFKLEENNIRVVYMRNPINMLKNSEAERSAKAYFKMESGAEENNSNSELEEVNKKLIEYMEKEMPFLDPDLTLPELAKSLDVSRNLLSNVINQKHGLNFYQFVNQYRVEEVKKLMADPANSNLKLISLAYDAGFNSKASFNRIFKQMTKMTPSEYYSRHKKAV